MNLNKKFKTKKNKFQKIKNNFKTKKNKFQKIKNKYSCKIKKGGTLIDKEDKEDKYDKEDKSYSIIKKFMINNKSKIKALFLKNICFNSGFCIAFGIESENIKKFFNYFISGDFIKLPITRIGENSVNGFINLITYERNGYKSNSILKSSNKINSDNLYYEYLVGKFINKYNKIYPCFLETYGLFKYNNQEDWNYVKSNNIINTNIFKNNLTFLPDLTINDSCKNSLFLALLTQYIENSKTLFQKMNDKEDQFFKFDLLYIIYQIYMPLSSISDIFTHYDLHLNNILICEPIKNSYIQYYYHSSEENNNVITEFKSRYLAKIIDYGRAYFKDNLIDSLKIYNEVCKSIDCGESACGIDYGYKLLLPERYPGSTHFISSQQKNISHDLRLLYLIKKSKYPVFPELNEMLKDLNFENLYTEYGTKENNNFNSNSINNVNDAFEGLDFLVNLKHLKTLNEKNYSNLNKIGDLHIYENGKPIEFIKA